jgi:hypothetical protein
MANALSESEFQDKIVQIYKEEQLKVIEEKWNKLTKHERLLVIEMAKNIYPEKLKLVKEDKWYNTVGDIVGIFDPTGIVDLINGISYWRQGDKLFAVLSWISVIPLAGDIIAKPVIGLFKVAGPTAKAFKAASLAGDVAKMSEIAKKSGPLTQLLKKVPEWGPKILEPLKKAVNVVPYVGPKTVKQVDDFIDLFKSAGKNIDTAVDTSIKLTGKGLKNPLTKSEAKALDKALQDVVSPRGFRDYGTGKNSWLSYMKSDAGFLSKFAAGMPRILGGNPATRSLMKRTKWYLGLLDYLNISNFVGPEELPNQVQNLDQKIEDYSKTDQSLNLLQDDLNAGTIGEPEKPQQQLIPQTAQPPKPDIDPFSLLFNGLFT